MPVKNEQQWNSQLIMGLDRDHQKYVDYDNKYVDKDSSNLDDEKYFYEYENQDDPLYNYEDDEYEQNQIPYYAEEETANPYYTNNEDYEEKQEVYTNSANIYDSDEQEELNENIPITTLLPFKPEEIAERVYIKSVEGKGRCLFSRSNIAAGEVIFIESPVLAAAPNVDPQLWSVLQELNAEEPLIMPPIWHLGAIVSLRNLSLEAQKIVQNKFVPDPNEEPSRDVIRILEVTQLALDPYKYERVLNVWRFNGFGHHTEEDGLILYNNISNMAHSCEASATWHYASGDSFVLRARRHLEPEDEITISYIKDEDLLKPTHIRREKLGSWQFVCKCSRCANNVDLCRGFLCPSCACGTVYLKTDYDETSSYGYYTIASECETCCHRFSAEEITRYEELENSYIARLSQTSKEMLLDAQQVYLEAGRVFSNHHVMYELDTILQDAYKSRGMFTEACFHLQKRINYIKHVCKRISFTLCGLWEELGDLTCQELESTEEIDGFKKNKILRVYENAFNGLITLCGADHEYTISAHNKFELIDKMEWKDTDNFA